MAARRRLGALLVAVFIAAAIAIPLLRPGLEREHGAGPSARGPGSPPPAKPSVGAPPARAKVSRVVDGDTFQLAGGERVRLLGIDTPETGAPGHDEARAACRLLVEGKEVELEVPAGSPRDTYGRLLALVRANDRSVNEEMLRRGLAVVYQKSSRDPSPDVRRRFIATQNEAIDARRGLWADARALSDPPGVTLVATRFRFHRAGCRSLVEEGRKVPASPTHREAALRSGRSPCRNCKPRRSRSRRFSPPCKPHRLPPGWLAKEGRRAPA